VDKLDLVVVVAVVDKAQLQLVAEEELDYSAKANLVPVVQTVPLQG
jgi:hypothetical protein